MSSRHDRPPASLPGSAHRSRGTRERQLRIIAGRWRGRRWRFPPSALRPTPDRVRETLFNWLQQRTEGAHCLDLFAGSGALGLEALSRGAASVTFVEQQRVLADALEQLLSDWQATGARVVCARAQQFLAGRRGAAQHATAATSADAATVANTDAAAGRGFDLVFLDPPFAAGELGAVTAQLERRWLAPGARIYLEHARAAPLPALPAGWQELRAGTAGEVGYHLFAPAGGATE
ncbi:MAG TPA: 16S rRNA (guanine(966)-N(2))-methyltransferase RsmD [Steroidobacteraceae bacterium]|nr:16S rRNA (guanine(966)-N(2))-methyltransferase RsmD [Steroidobacteraceae bacterium]